MTATPASASAAAAASGERWPPASIVPNLGSMHAFRRKTNGRASRGGAAASLDLVRNRRRLQPALRTLPADRQLVQTRTRLCVPLSVTIRAGCRFGRQTRLLLLFAWLTLFPLRGPFPQTSQNAIGVSWCSYASCGGTSREIYPSLAPGSTPRRVSPLIDSASAHG